MLETVLRRIVFVAVISIVYLVPPISSGSDNCEDKVASSKLTCYNCDTRINETCKDPFDNSTSNTLNMTKNCKKGCIKVVYTNPDPEENWIRRGCTEDVIKFKWLSANCLAGKTADILMCVCDNESLCNKASAVLTTNTVFTSAIIAFSTLVYLFAI